MKARAFLGNSEVSVTMNVLPYTAEWEYGVNTNSVDTLGGRVVQVLSVDIGSLEVQSVAVSRAELQRLAQGFQNIMKYHVRTQEPVVFRVPSMKWAMVVYLEAVPELGWAVQTVSYPFQLSMRVVDDLNLTKTNQLMQNQLNRLAEGIGYNPNVHGGDAPSFATLVNNLDLRAFGTSTSSGSEASTNGSAIDPNGGTKTDGGAEQFRGSSAFKPGISNMNWQGDNLREKVRNMLVQFANRNAVFTDADIERGLCTIQWESGWDPSAVNSDNSDGSIDRGLWQLNTIHKNKDWWPDDVNLLFNPEYNTRCALQIWTDWGSYSPWYGYKNHCTGI